MKKLFLLLLFVPLVSCSNGDGAYYNMIYFYENNREKGFVKLKLTRF